MRNAVTLRIVLLVATCMLAGTIATRAQRTVTTTLHNPPTKTTTTQPTAGRVPPASKPAPPSPPSGSAYAGPNNYFGAHLLVEDGEIGTRGRNHLKWARHLVGRWGYAKTLFAGIDRNTTTAARGWVDYVEACYQLELIPVIRLGGVWKDGGWLAPQADGPGDYRSMATAVKNVVRHLPRSNMCPLYIEVWNEPNVPLEWSGKPDPKEYADFFVQVAEAIRSIEDDRIRILNGGLATNYDWVEALCRANPKFVTSFDVWASHPYPQNHPPAFNYHDRTARFPAGEAIDAYVPELEILRKFGRDNVKVMITETGYDLGNSTFASAGFPPIDEINRAAYMIQAFRDCYRKWPEVLAVLPFEFSGAGWERFDWVYPDSATSEAGTPTKAHHQYAAVAALAKPTDRTGSIGGRVTVAKLGSPLEGVRVFVNEEPLAADSDELGNYIIGPLKPGGYRLVVKKAGFTTREQKVTVAAAGNSVVDCAIVAEQTQTLTGTVTSGDDDKPLWGVEVTLSPGKHAVRTDKRGRYELPDCIPARYTLRAERRGLLTYETTVTIALHGKNAHDFTLGRKVNTSTQRRSSSTQPTETNMLTNPSFEAGAGGGGRDTIGLSFEPLTTYRDGTVALSERYAHTGRFSQELRLSPQPVAIRQITYYNTAQPRKHYVAGGWIRVDSSDEEAKAWISLSATRNDGSVLDEATPHKKVLGRTEGWAWIQVLLTAPAETQRLSVNLNATGSRGSACFDDLTLEAIDRPEN